MTLFSWPTQSLVNRVLPKNKVYANARLSTRLKEAFVSELDKIVWRAKLAPETIRLTATKDVPEIQVFELALRTADINEDIPRTIDKAIPFPILFELAFEGKVRMLAAWKRPQNQNQGGDSGQWIVGDYLATPWMPAESRRENLPVALNMSGLYEQMLRAFAPQPPRRGETMGEHMERLARIRALQTEAEKLERRLAQEKQFNRKVEINGQVRTVRSEIAALSEESPREERGRP
jgi:hypothetical protein